MKPVYTTRKVPRNYSLGTPFPLTCAKASGGLSTTSESDRREPMTFDEKALQLRKVRSAHQNL